MLADSHGRHFKYLRLSLTDVCNFSCSYCLPNGFQKTNCSELSLSRQEIRNMAVGFAALGVEKIRLTGGEPTIRPDVVEICSDLSQIKGIQKIAITTNGYRLPAIIEPLIQAGLHSLNVSIDSLDRLNFKNITGNDKLETILKGLTLAKKKGIGAIKINAVLLKNENDHELPLFLELAKSNPVSIRFIELMRTGQNGEYFDNRHLSTDVIKNYLLETGWQKTVRAEFDGPAIEFTHPDYQGRIGLIAPYSKDFCQNCNRLRVSSRGGLKLCLFGDGEFNLRPWLQAPDQKNELIHQILINLKLKQARHSLHELKFGNTYNLSSIGG